MSAPSKRRSVIYYLSLPIVVAVVFLLVAQLVAMQRAEIIADLTERIDHRDSKDAAVAVHQLGEMPRPPAAVLVGAAASTDRIVAKEGQLAIGKSLRRVQQRIQAGRGLKSAARQLDELAQALANDRHAFSAADRAWLVSTTQRILRLADGIPLKHTPLVATHCDLILTSIHPTTVEHSEEVVADTESDEDIDPILDELTIAPVPEKDTSVVPPDAQASKSDNATAPWRKEWTRPVFRSLPTAAMSAAPGDSTSAGSPSNGPAARPARPPATIQVVEPLLIKDDAGALLRKWLNAEGEAAERLEKDIAARLGFGQLSKPLVERFCSNDRDVRLRLVDEVTTTAGVNAGPWLMLLAEDTDADVRLAAVTYMATSTDPVLVEKAWQTVIRDRDPRIAALAPRLRDRRAETQKR